MDLADITPEQATRALLLAATGSGKSTVSCAVLESYHRLYPGDRLYIIDPKRRFVATRRPRDAAPGCLFPGGYDARLIGKRKGVRVYGRLIRPAMGFNFDDTVYVVQDESKVNELFLWLYSHADARRPVLVYLDESFDMMHGSSANKPLRKLYQQGRELGIGILTVNQRPRGIDRVWLTEAEYLIVGTIRHYEDLVYLAKNANAPRGTFDAPLPRYVFQFVDQSGGRPNRQFRLKLAA